jgi:hypothetical protein
LSNVETIKRRLKRKDAWHRNYLDDLVDSATRVLANDLANDGPRAQCEFLLQNGWTVDEIVSAGRKVRRLIHKHMSGLIEKKHRRK